MKAASVVAAPARTALGLPPLPVRYPWCAWLRSARQTLDKVLVGPPQRSEDPLMERRGMNIRCDRSHQGAGPDGRTAGETRVAGPVDLQLRSVPGLRGPTVPG